MANNKVAKKEQGSNIVDISLLLEDAETGHNMSNDDMMIPRLRILQTGSPQVNKREGQYVEGAEAGHIFDSVSNKAYDGEAGLTVVPVSYRTTFIEWKADRKGLVADHGNKPELLNNCTQSEKGKYFTPEGNEMVRSAEYFVYVVAEDGSYTPALISTLRMVHNFILKQDLLKRKLLKVMLKYLQKLRHLLKKIHSN